MANEKTAHVDSVIEKLTEFHKQATSLIQEKERLNEQGNEIYENFIELLSSGSGDILSLQGIFDRDLRNFKNNSSASEPSAIKYKIEESLQNVLLYRQVGMGE